MKNIFIWTIKQRIESKSRNWIVIINDNFSICEYIWKQKKENWFKWVEFEWKLEEWTKITICYDWDFEGKIKKFMTFIVWEQIKENMKDLIIYK